MSSISSNTPSYSLINRIPKENRANDSPVLFYLSSVSSLKKRRNAPSFTGQCPAFARGMFRVFPNETARFPHSTLCRNRRKVKVPRNT